MDYSSLLQCIVHGAWCMVHGAHSTYVVYGALHMEHSALCMVHGAAKHNAHIVLSVWCIVVVNPVFARPSGQQPLKCISHPLLHDDDNEHEYMMVI